MKKSILALAVAGALAIPFAAQADTILYGSARVSVDYNDETLDSVDTDGNWDVVNDSSRLGVVGSEDLGGGLNAVYRYEFGVDMTEGGNWDSNRPKYVGLKGGFGTLTLGTQDTPYYNVAGITDIFNSGKTFLYPQWLGGGFSLSGDRSQADGDLVRLSNSVYYSTPDFSGFSGEAMLVMNGPSSDISNDVDIWNLAVKYSNGPFFAGASYIKLEGKSNIPLNPDTLPGVTYDLDLSNWVLGLGYNSGPFGVGFIYEQGSLYSLNLFTGIKDTAGTQFFPGDDANNWYLTGQYVFGNNTLRAAYGQLDTGVDGDDKIDNYVVGYQYNFSKRTSIWVEYIGRSASLYNVPGDASTGLFMGDQNAASIGTRVDF
ncbi:MAG: porin [Candidatus Competibacteraceae bacterium]|nr:MAG: porin [Candidatus Competibacteraceae bacterium]